MAPMSENATTKLTEFKAGVHEIDPARDIEVQWNDPHGNTASLSAFRVTEDDDVLAHALVHDLETGELMAGEVRLTERRLRAASVTSLEFIQRHEKGFIVLGVAAVGIVGATGIAVRRFRHRM